MNRRIPPAAPQTFVPLKRVEATYYEDVSDFVQTPQEAKSYFQEFCRAPVLSAVKKVYPTNTAEGSEYQHDCDVAVKASFKRELNERDKQQLSPSWATKRKNTALRTVGAPAAGGRRKTRKNRKNKASRKSKASKRKGTRRH